MGITNLLPLLEASTRDCNISEFRGRTVAIDTYCWLHKGSVGCAMQIIRGEHADQYVTYILKYIKLLLSFDIKPILVFDGQPLPAKAHTEEQRRESRRRAKQQGMELLRLGQKSEAYKYFQRALDVTHDMAAHVIRECRIMGVDCIVAPYEADAQLAFFSLRGIADCIITEDSDLLLFGCKKVLFKMDMNGNGRLVEADKISVSMKVDPSKYSFEKFRHMCILSGCDYLPSLPGIGIKKALDFVKLTAETNPMIFLDRLARYSKVRTAVADEAYKEKFMIADATFKHQTVFDPFLGEMVPLTPIPEDMDPKYCVHLGEIIPPEFSIELAFGNVNPLTCEFLDIWEPKNLSSNSIWSNHFNGGQPSETLKKEMSTPKGKKTSNVRKSTPGEHFYQTSSETIERELEFYKNPPPEPATMEVVAEPVLSPSVSLPVENNNPFLNKKISKFGLTQMDAPNKKIVSKFFNSTQESSQNNEPNKTDDEKTEIEELERILKLTRGTGLEIRKVTDLVDRPPPRPILNIECEIITHVDETLKIDFKNGFPVVVDCDEVASKSSDEVASKSSDEQETPPDRVSNSNPAPLKQTKIQQFFKRRRTDNS